MIEVIQSDFARLEAETSAAEKQGAQARGGDWWSVEDVGLVFLGPVFLGCLFGAV